MAANLLGVDRVRFLLKRRDYDINMVNLTEAKLRFDLANAWVHEIIISASPLMAVVAA